MNYIFLILFITLNLLNLIRIHSFTLTTNEYPSKYRNKYPFYNKHITTTTYKDNIKLNSRLLNIKLSLSQNNDDDEVSASIIFLSKAALVGGITGFCVHAFKSLINMELTLFYENLAAVLPKPVIYWPFILYPLLGSVGVALITLWRGPIAIKHGVDYTAQSLIYQLPTPTSNNNNVVIQIDNTINEAMIMIDTNSNIQIEQANLEIETYNDIIQNNLPSSSSTIIKASASSNTSTITNNYDPIVAIFDPLDLLSRTMAAICTLGSGCSLGPEGPAVEIGVGISRMLCTGIQSTLRERHHLFLAGTAAGVAAGFNAPVGGILFAIECGNRYLTKNGIYLSTDSTPDSSSTSRSKASRDDIEDRPRADIAAIALAATTAAITVQFGNTETVMLEVHGEGFMSAPFVQLPLYLGLGIVCSIITVLFTKMKDLASDFFAGKGVWEGENGILNGSIGSLLASTPSYVKPMIGGVVCGVAAVFLPQTLFVGYATLDQLIIGKIPFQSALLVQIIFTKMFLTTFSLGSGLIGGIFAPSLFLGALAGSAYHSFIESIAQYTLTIIESLHLSSDIMCFINDNFIIAGAPAYATVGAAATLGAIFRAPLTASMIMYELTQNHDIVLPVLASTGLAGLFAEIIAKPRKQLL